MRSYKILFTILMYATAIYGCKKKNPQPDADITNGLHIKNGKYLVDKCGNKVLIRGINIGNIDAVNLGIKEIEEIEKTGANTVRFVLTRQYQDWSNGGAVTTLSAAKIEYLLTSFLAKGMMSIVALHDFTGSTNVAADLPRATQWWTKSDIKATLSEYQKSIILNIANEPDNGSASSDAYANANLTAVKALRNAGYTCPIMIDAPDWGKNHLFVVDKGQALMDADPLHNLISSVHAYWPTIGAYSNHSDIKITENFSALKRTGLPITPGELARADILNGLIYSINHRLMMRLSQEKEFGYSVWWWGFYNNPTANNLLSITNDGLLSGLQSHGKMMAIDDVNSIKNTSRRVFW